MGVKAKRNSELGRLEARNSGRFRSTQEGSLEECFLSLRQEGTVKEYRLMFETLAMSVLDVLEALLEGQFLNGLKLEIRVRSGCCNPEG